MERQQKTSLESCLGIIAGAGGLPFAVVSSCLKQNRPFFILALENFTDPELLSSYPHAWVRLGAVGEAFNILRKEGISELTMAGNLHRPSLKELRPDMRGIAFFAKLGVKALGDDGLLQAVTKEMETEGFKIVGVHDICPDLLTTNGTIGKVKPNKINWKDIQQGWHLAKQLGMLDVGQAVVLQDGLVLGLEAIEGTDALIERTGTLKRKGEAPVLVKCCKPQQDERVDMPTIGLKTIENAIEAGFSGIALEAGKTLFLEQDKAIMLADKNKFFIYGILEQNITSGEI